MKNLAAYLLAAVLLAACNSNKNSPEPVATDKTDSTKKDFFPVSSFLGGQLMLMDSLQVTPLKINVKDGKEDSIWIKIPELKTELRDFAAVDITGDNLASFFKESKFNDESTGAITFTYTPGKKLPDSIAVKHWDVYINPETGRVKRVYIVRQVVEGGLPLTQQLTWQTDKSARITTIQNKPDGSSTILKDTKLIWGF